MEIGGSLATSTTDDNSEKIRVFILNNYWWIGKPTYLSNGIAYEFIRNTLNNVIKGKRYDAQPETSSSQVCDTMD